ncbi:MAG: FecR domain-containing protein [Ginsengibacter sp.]
MNYHDCDIEDLILDPSFQNYCLGRNERDEMFWRSWILANPDHHEKIEQATKLYFLLSGNNTAPQFRKDKQAFLKAFKEYVKNAEPGSSPGITSKVLAIKKTKRSRALFIYAGSITASLLLLILIYHLNMRQAKGEGPVASAAKLIYRAFPGERKSLALPDGSLVTLNVGTTIEVAADFNLKERQVILNGEAYFKIAHNAAKPFIIHTSTLDVRVLGTELNVKAYPQDKTTETILIRGSVEVVLNNKKKERIILTPLHKLVTQNVYQPFIKSPASVTKRGQKDTGKITISPVAINTYDSTIRETLWVKNRLVFNDETLADVAVKIERWYNVKVNVDTSIATKFRFTGIFENENIRETLKALQHSLYFNYRIENDSILITK